MRKKGATDKNENFIPTVIDKQTVIIRNNQAC